MNKDKFYITTAIDYASGKPHFGHAYEKVAADVLARWNRNIGKDVFFMTGTDEHGQKIVEKAKEASKNPKEFVDIITPQFKLLCEKLNISYDYFIRTTNENHKKFVQKMLQKSYDKGDIYKGTYSGLYCVGCERYYTADELIDGKICPDHKKEVEFVEEENYFFKLLSYQNKLIELYEKNPDFLSPNSRAQETINRVKEGLQDISISRNKEKLDWGVELPFDKSHVTYVWFDALFNYVSGLKINDKEDFWPAEVHLVGKDVMWFHNVYWPAFLMSVGLDLPRKVFAHGHVLDGVGHKMSKSLGNVIDPVKFSKKYGVDEFRYFVVAGGSFGEDVNFSEELFAHKINNELNNDLGNLVSRVHGMVGKYFEGVVPKASKVIEVDHEFIAKLNIFESFNSQMQSLEFNKAIETLWSAIRETNAYINAVAPWKESDKERLATTMNILCSAVKLFASYLECFMPEKTQRLFKQYNVENENKFEFEFFKSEHKLGQKDNLFEKIVLEVKEEKPKEMKKREGFATLNLKVGKIVEVKQHPEAEKLYIEKINLGEAEPRQIVSGLKDYYKIEELLGRKVIVAANLKPAKLRGEMSQGMVLVSESEDEKHIGLLETDAEVGTNLVCNKEIADNEEIIKVDAFFKISMSSDGQKVYYESKEIKAGDKELKVHKEIKGNVC